MGKTRYNAEVRYSAQMGALVAEVRRAGAAQTQAIQGVTRAIETQTTGWRGLGNDLVRIRAAYSLVVGAIGGVARAGFQLAEAQARERTESTQLARALSLQGVELQGHQADIERLTESYNSLIREADSAVRVTMAQLAQRLQGMGLSYQQLATMSRRALDVMVVYGRDAASAAEVVASAATGNVRSLRSLLPEAARELRALGEEGATTEAVMARLDEALRGANTAISEDEQRIIRAGNAWDNFKDRLGGFLLDVAGPTLDWLSDTAGAVGNLVDEMERGQNAPQQFQQSLEAFRQRASGAAPAVAIPPSQAQIEDFFGPPVTAPAAAPPASSTSGGRRPRAPASASPFGGLEAAEQALADARDQGLERLRDWLAARQELYQTALQATRDFYDAEANVENSRMEKLTAYSDQRRALLETEVAAERSRRDAVLGTLGDIAANAANAVGSVIKGERPLAVWRAAMMAAEVGWQLLVEHNPLGAAKAAGTFALYEVAKAIAGASGGGGRGGSAGARTGYSGTSNPTTAGALIGGPSNGGRTVNVSVTFQDSVVMADNDQMREHIVRAWNEAERRGEIR